MGRAMFKRVIWIILDSVGIGALPDAKDYGDEGADTLGHIMQAKGKLSLPNLERLGLFSIPETSLPKSAGQPVGAFGKSAELSVGKDTTTGHWEMTGIHTRQAFPTYPTGFPKELLRELMVRSGLSGYLGNLVASGTQIIQSLGDEHMRTGYPIIYTSADSVFQIAAHESVIPIQELYRICQTARELLQGDHAVARVIARPFVREDGRYVRTSNRRDFSLEPSRENLLCYMKDAGYRVTGIGKITDIFAGVGIGDTAHTKNNMDGMDQTLDFMETQYDGLIFTNLVEFDSTWGHRRDVDGYAQGLIQFDERISEVLAAMKEDDLLIINADHGCDPTFRGTDHTREYVPVLVWHKQMEEPVNLGVLKSFADIGATIAENFGVGPLPIGSSFKKAITV